MTLTPGQWSLWDVIQVLALQIGGHFRTLEKLDRTASRHGKNIVPHADLLKHRPAVNTLVADLEKFEVGISVTDAAENLKRAVGMNVTGDVLRALVGYVHQGMKSELRFRTLWHPSRKSHDVMAAFGDDWRIALAAFPDAKNDAHEALWAFAFERFTASVFHLMRAAEHGLRALAKRLKVTLPRNVPIEFAQWQNVLNAVDQKLKVENSTTASKKRAETLDRYATIAADLRGMKDMYRNSVMHSRTVYVQRDAENAMFYVRELLTRLADK